MVLKVELENNVWMFSPGQKINGRVVVTKNIWHKVEGLSIRFLGKMEFGSPASAPTPPPQDTLPQSIQQDSLFSRLTRSRPVQEVVLDDKQNLIHSWKVLKPGSHEFSFTYIIPEDANLPESVKLEGFRILYEFVVVLRRPRDDYKIYQTPFYVQNGAEEREHLFPYYSDAIEKKTEEHLGFCVCCKSGPYGILFRVRNRVAAVGKDIDFILEIWNDSRANMDRAKIRLVREFKHKKGLEMKKKEILSELAGPAVSSGEHEIWSSFFRIPANTPPTNCVRRETFEINYFLKALIYPLNQPNKKVSLKYPLLLIKEVEPIEPCESAYVEGTSCGAEKETNDAPSPHPPTYEEAVGADNSSGSPLLEQ